MRTRRTSAPRHLELPRSDETPHPSRWLLHAGRPLARFVVRRRFAVQRHHVDQFPTSGPVILAANHVGMMDGPLLGLFGPRPVHTLTKSDMFVGVTGRFLSTGGQIRLDRWAVDPAAMKTSLRVLRDGGVIGIFPEGARGKGDLHRFHRGAAYLGLVTGAPVVPVTFLGTREPGAGLNALPPRGGHVDMVFGAPYVLEAVPWPRRREQVAEASLLLREHMLGCLDEARRLTGRALPGPMPSRQPIEDDPNTDVVEQGAS